MGCFCAVPEEFYCEVLLLDESKLTLTTQQQGIKVRTPAGLRNAMRERPRGCPAAAASRLRCGSWEGSGCRKKGFREAEE